MKPKKRGARSGKTRVFVSKLPGQFPLGLGSAWANIRWQKNCDSGVRKGTCDWRDHNRHLCDLQLAGTVPAQPKVQKHSMRRLRYQILLRSQSNPAQLLTKGLAPAVLVWASTGDHVCGFLNLRAFAGAIESDHHCYLPIVARVGDDPCRTKSGDPIRIP